jgi:Zn-dependent M28 family amino/carboxypeptidase
MKKIITKKINIIFTIIILIVCAILVNVNLKSNMNTKTNTVKKENPNIQDKNISIEDIINTLCSDKFEGRRVGTKGNDYTVQYISDIFGKIKLDYVFQNSYFHEYPFKYSPPQVHPGDPVISIDIRPKNVIGKISGNNNNNNNNAVIISAHLDHLGIQDGKIYRGALDDASGIAALLKIAYNLKALSEKKAFDFDIIICAFNGEEYALSGSKAFVGDIKTRYNKLYNINLDCIGGIDGGNLALKNISRIKQSEKLYQDIENNLIEHEIEFSDTAVSEEAFTRGVGIGDQDSFEKAGIPNIYIGQEDIKSLVHKVTDTPEKLDCKKIENISDTICDFVENDGSTIF